MSYKAYKTFKC